MLTHLCTHVHISIILSEGWREGRRKGTTGELQRVLVKAGMTGPRKAETFYIVLKHLRTEGLNTLLILYNKMWEEERIPASWSWLIVL